MRSARAIDDCDDSKVGGNWDIDTRLVLIQKTCLKSRRKYTMGEEEFRRKHVKVFGCFVFPCIHACFGPRHGRDIYNSHTRATANRWGEDDSLCMSESTYRSTSSLSILIRQEPTCTNLLLLGFFVCIDQQCPYAVKLTSSGYTRTLDSR